MKIYLYEDEIKQAVKYIKENNPHKETWTELYIRDLINSLAKYAFDDKDFMSIGSDIGILLVKNTEESNKNTIYISLYLTPQNVDFSKQVCVSVKEIRAA